MKIGGWIVFHGRHGGHDGWVGQDQTHMNEKGKPPWLSLMEEAQKLRAEAMKRPGMKQVDIGLMAGAIVLTCYRDRC
jgi:hypothetical protein